MKAISIRQPWASLIARGIKTIELRSWTTRYRGRLLVCASKGDVILPEGTAPGGVALCTTELYDIRKTCPDDLVPSAMPDDAVFADIKNSYAWLLRNTQEIIPFPVKGKLSLFEVEDSFIQDLPKTYASHFAYLASIQYKPKNIRKEY